MKKITLQIFLCINVLFCFAQPNNPPENLDKAGFKSWLKQNWYNDYENVSSTNDGYKNARLQMYNVIDIVNGDVFCFYSDYAQTVPSNLTTPGNFLPIDCEHIVPQSIFGGSGKMKNDIHHLAPTYSNWNSSRGNLPFDECIDENTTKWMRFDDDITCANNCAPTNYIDEYSELISNVSFEPKEDVKGNVARSVFYFFTMYPAYTIDNVADVDVLYQWHLNDLPDALEMERNDEVEAFQGNRNPYIDYPEWVAKAWIESTTVSIEQNNKVKFYIDNHVSDGLLKITLKNSNAEKLNFQLFNSNGKLLMTSDYYYGLNNFNIKLDVNFLPNGNYILKVNDQGHFSKTKKFIITN